MGTRMQNRLYVLGIMLIAYVLFAFFGNNKREEKNVPVGMKLLARQPVQRYLMYVAGCSMIIFNVVVIVTVILYGGEIFVIVVSSIVFLGCAGLFFLCGRYCYTSHIFFGDERIMIGQMFGKPDILLWEEIGKVEMKKNRIRI
ncbi:hypothetical protein E5329_14265 [Petralouisia muris]|uniref:Uncharacterized protein n=1 Tax=Petralouisia muris TaxID=3032872 RepID=A0AC61RUZ4_9FIRM|nr:hypothetical protein [Petralouisia muris]TGY95582.1 hypothetical protein E5329_14265 [Petralouisia muris]